MGGTEKSRLEAEEAGLVQAIKRAEAEVSKVAERRDALKQNINRLKKTISRLESKGPKIITLTEYRKMRTEVVQLYRELAVVEVDLRQKDANLKRMCRDLQSTQDSLRPLRQSKSQ